MFSFKLVTIMRKYFAICLLLVSILSSCTPEEYTYVDRYGEKPSDISYVEIPDFLEGGSFTSSEAYITLASNVFPEFFMENVSKDGVNLDDVSVFKIDTLSGVVTLNEANNLVAGSYNVGVKVRTFNNAAALLEDGTYELTKVLHDSVTFIDALSFVVLPKLPESITYTPNLIGAKPGKAFSSAIPVVVGSKPTLHELFGENADLFQIDANTGVISLPADHTVAEKTYLLSVKVTNEAGVVEFPNVLTVVVAPATEVVVQSLNLPAYGGIKLKVEDDNIPEMSVLSVDPLAPVQDISKKKWSKAWGLWYYDFGDGKEYSIEFIPAKSEQEDYIWFDDKVSLVDAVKANVELVAAHAYGSFNYCNFDLIVSEDFTGDASSATWKHYPVDMSAHALEKRIPQKYEFDISEFDGKEVTIGLYCKHFLTGSTTLSALSKNLLVKDIVIKATK
ncbi:hypothetical protein K4L44_01915 [Halosquirtibacter laminarini]|uniref:Uncharacterized protein n=1 Tax=Halosquirtibacter laminarini TaxID=3374600 RepID=A0AC61NPT3_9BACT|nr:hypothetical protein K4L44_01915 [Prolixibacteraceae bacterium]